MATGSRLKRFVFVLVYVAILVILFEGLSYIAVVHFYDNKLGNQAERHLFSSIRGHQLNPDYSRTFDTEDKHIHSEQGFRRDTLVSKDKPQDVFRIMVLGGSALYGIGPNFDKAYPAHRTLFNDETIPHYLEEMLNERIADDPGASKIEVINAGVTAYHTFQHVLYIYETLHEYSPDMILFVDGHNDFYNVGTENPISEYGYSSFNMVNMLNERRPFYSAYLGTRWLSKHSYFFRLLEKMTLTVSEIVEVRPYSTFSDPTALQRDIEQEIEDYAKISYLRNYKLIESLADIHDFSFHVFLQPEVVYEDMDLLSEHDQDIAEITRKWYGKELETIMIETRRKLPGLFAASEIPFTDIGEIAGPSETGAELYLDYCHLSPRGSYLVAEQMLPVVEEMVRRQLAGQSRPPRNATTLPVNKEKQYN